VTNKGRGKVVITCGFVALVLAALPPAFAEDATKNAERQYNTYCAQCHGVKRNGKGINSRTMSVQPRDHTDAKGMGAIPDNEVFKVIKEGGLSVNKSVLMPAWGSVLSDDEIRDLVKYLRQICNCGNTH
jgi:cytochrome c oxidase cbb3-type subunit 3